MKIKELSQITNSSWDVSLADAVKSKLTAHSYDIKTNKELNREFLANLIKILVDKNILTANDISTLLGRNFTIEDE